MSIFKCKMCGGTIEFEQGATVGVCDSCGTKQTLPKLDDDRRANLYDRANHFRRNNEFDKAMGIYESILNEDRTDAEAYWSLVLCRYGIEYVDDPSSHRRIPTVNRAQYTSIFADEDYKSAIENADALQKTIYEEEAKQIDEIQKGILEISQKEEPFDVFICYKETGADGRRTVDSVRATELYHELTKEGFKVFFSRITLEDKLGTAYEPYIFAALNSAKVMVVLGTKAEHFNAVWVKNEWSRYLSLIKSGAKKTLIPAYQDMDPYDLPEEFSHLQALDMGKLGFMQDLIRGIKKITAADEPKAVVKETVVVNNGGNGGSNVNALIDRGYMALEDGEWEKADGFFEEALNQDAKNAQCYLGKLMAELNVKNKDSLKNSVKTFDENNNYKKACRFDPKIENELKAVNDFIRERNRNATLNNKYNEAVKLSSSLSESDLLKAYEIFNSISNFKDSEKLSKECLEKSKEAHKLGLYRQARNFESENNYESAIKCYEEIKDYSDSTSRIESCKEQIYSAACSLVSDYEKSLDLDLLKNASKEFSKIQNYKDSNEKIKKCAEEINEVTKKYSFKTDMKRIANIAKSGKKGFILKAIFDIALAVNFILFFIIFASSVDYSIIFFILTVVLLTATIIVTFIMKDFFKKLSYIKSVIFLRIFVEAIISLFFILAGFVSFIEDPSLTAISLMVACPFLIEIIINISKFKKTYSIKSESEK